MVIKFNLTPEERMKENILNGLDENASVFRFVKTDRLFEILKTKKIALVKPWKWDDPFENFLSKTVVVNKKKERIGFNLTNDFYGQCWTLSDECDGIWRNYSSLENGARIESTTTSLLASIYDMTNDTSKLSCFIGKVVYETDTNIPNMLSQWISQIVIDHTGKEIAKMLLIKREEFSYENEVRLLYSKEESKDNDVVEFKIDPLYLISSIKFSPKMNSGDFERYKKDLIKYGFSEDKISKSTLYEPYSIEIPYDGI